MKFLCEHRRNAEPRPFGSAASIRPERTWKVRSGMLAWSLFAWIGCFGSITLAQPASTPETSTGADIAILQQEPYDLIKIKEEAKGGEVRVQPLDLPDRKMPAPIPTGVLRVRPLSRPAEEYEVGWGSIESIDFWETKLLREAQTRIAKKDFDGAYPFLAVLLRDYPKTPGLDAMRTELVYQNAITAFRENDWAKTLALMEELRRFNPRYEPQKVAAAISRVTDLMLQQLLDKGQLEDAQLMLGRLSQRFTEAEIASIPKWRATFRQMSEAKRDEAIAARDARDFRRARDLALEMMHIDPTIPNGKELVREIDLAYPLVRVGVMQQAVELDPTRIDNWAARRAGRLVYRAMFEMLGASVEGGEYAFPLGQANVADDRLSMQLTIRDEQLPPPFEHVDAYRIADLILERADPNHPLYNPAWAGVFADLSVPRPNEIVARFRRPHVLPQAMLQLRLDSRSLSTGDDKSISGAYQHSENDEGATVFRFAGPGKPAETQPREIVEIKMGDGNAAMSALLRGDVDVMDQLFPADAARLRKSGRVRVVDYPLPTLHLLIPWSEHPFVTDRTTRRGILYGINRQEILDNDLTGGEQIPGCQVLSGPIPAGIGVDDPLGYAYDRSIEPRPYQPRLGALLLELRKIQWDAEAKKKETEPPKIEPLRIAYPANEMARVACQAIAQQLMILKLEVKLIELPVGQSQPALGECDLLYSIVAMWEPAVDTRRVLGLDGLARSNDQLIGLGLRQLESAKSWREVRDHLLELHRISHHELPVLPLYQLVDSFAYQPALQGVGSEIVSLYQNITRWRLNR